VSEYSERVELRVDEELPLLQSTELSHLGLRRSSATCLLRGRHGGRDGRRDRRRGGGKEGRRVV
jgi:hypothetical protein